MIWLANALTLSRIPLGLAFWLVADRPGPAIAITLVGAFTDVIDGPIARWERRRRGEPPAGTPDRPVLGAWLDPLCDKFFVLSVLLGTFVVMQIPPAMFAAVAAREIVLVPLAALYRFTPWLRARMRYDFTAGPAGKAATVAQILALVAILTQHPARWPLACVAGAVGLAAAAHYVARGVRLARLARV